MASRNGSLQGSRAHYRMAQLTSTLRPSAVAGTKPVGEFDKHGDNRLRVPEMFDVRGKVALVTGGSSGIGRMIAEGLAVNGCKVYITSRKHDACEATAKELRELAAGSGGEVIPFASNLGEIS